MFYTLRLADKARTSFPGDKFSNEKHVRKHALYAIRKQSNPLYFKFYTTWTNSDATLRNKCIISRRKKPFFSPYNVRTII